MGRETEVLFSHVVTLYAPLMIMWYGKNGRYSWRWGKTDFCLPPPPTLHPVLITGITFSTFFLATVMKSRWKAISKNSSLSSYRKMLLKTMLYMTCLKTAFPKELVITAELQCRRQFRILQIGSVTCWWWSGWETVLQRQVPFDSYWWTTGMPIQTHLLSV